MLTLSSGTATRTRWCWVRNAIALTFRGTKLFSGAAESVLGTTDEQTH
jgi:hypothetical protein